VSNLTRLQQSEDRVNDWHIGAGADGGYAVFDTHGLVAGPFGTRAEALRAAVALPKSGEAVARWPSLRDVEPGSDADDGNALYEGW